MPQSATAKGHRAYKSMLGLRISINVKCINNYKRCTATCVQLTHLQDLKTSPFDTPDETVYDYFTTNHTSILSLSNYYIMT